MPTTSVLGSATAVEGLLIQVGDGASPQVFTTIANVTDFSEPVKADTVEVTNVGDHWKRRITTLLDMGSISFNIFWMMLDATQDNVGTGPAGGLRYLMINSILADWQVVYPDGSQSTDAFAAYVVSFSITGKTGDVFRAAITLANDGSPTLV